MSTKEITVKDVSIKFQRLRAAEARRANIDLSLIIKEEELLVFTESLRDMYEAGIPVSEVLIQLHHATVNKKFALAIRLLADDIENGKLLSEAMGRFPKVFGNDYRSLIRAAEQSGKWTRKRDKFGEMKEGILDMLISYIKRRNSARSKVKSGLIYPAFIGVGIIATLLVFAFYVLPALKDVFAQLAPADSLGSLTKGMFFVGDIIEHYWWLFPVIISALVALAYFYWHSEQGKNWWMHYQLRMKALGPLFANIVLGESMWLMGTLFSAGLTPQETLDIIAQACRNDEIAKAILRAREYLFQGVTFCDALKKAHWLFDGQAYMVLSSAQKSGRLGVALQSYASQLFERIDQGVEHFIKMIEPVMLVLAGVVVGVIVIAYYGSISSLIGGLNR